jgi:hypothetical protein
VRRVLQIGAALSWRLFVVVATLYVIGTVVAFLASVVVPVAIALLSSRSCDARRLSPGQRVGQCLSRRIVGKSATGESEQRDTGDARTTHQIERGLHGSGPML